MSETAKRAISATGILTAILLWFVGGIISGSTGIKKR